MINKNGNNIEGVADFVLPTMSEIDNLKASVDKLSKTDKVSWLLIGGGVTSPWEYAGTIVWDGTNTTKKYKLDFTTPKKEVFIYGNTSYNSINKGGYDILFNTENQATGRIYSISCIYSEQVCHIQNIGGNYVGDYLTTNNALVGATLTRKFARNIKNASSHSDDGFINDVTIHITTDIVRPSGVGQKWYIFTKDAASSCLYNVNNTVINFDGGNPLTQCSFNAKDIPTLNNMLIAAKNHTERDAPVEGIFTFVNFYDINGMNVPTPVSVKTTSVWYDEDGHFNCTFLLCGRICTLVSESYFLNEITGGVTFMITLE